MTLRDRLAIAARDIPIVRFEPCQISRQNCFPKKFLRARLARKSFALRTGQEETVHVQVQGLV